MQCEYADRVEQEHLQRFLSHKMADYVWDAQTSTRLEKQVSYHLADREGLVQRVNGKGKGTRTTTTTTQKGRKKLEGFFHFEMRKWRAAAAGPNSKRK